MTDKKAKTTDVVVHNTGWATRLAAGQRFHARERRVVSVSDEQLAEIRATPGLVVGGDLGAPEMKTASKAEKEG